jgi:hypothetical protein
MRRAIRSWFLLISAAAALGAHAVPPARVEVAYELSRNGDAIADVVERLEHAAGSYELTETSRGRGIYGLRGNIKRTSRGAVVAEGLRPIEFLDERTGRGITRAHFDWKAKRLTLETKGETQHLALPEKAQDRLSYVFNFAFRPPGREPVTVHLTDGRGLSTHVYEPAGRERVKTPAGEFDAIKLRRQSEDRSAEIWLAADRDYLPVRVTVVEKDGTRLEQVATRISTP